VGLVKDYQPDVPQRDPLGAEVIGDDLRRGHDDVVLQPLHFPLFRRYRPGKYGDPATYYLFLQEAGVLFHQRLGGRQEQHLPLAPGHDLGDDQERHHRLAQPGGDHYQSGFFQAGVRQSSLVVPLLDASWADQGMLDEHGRWIPPAI